MTDALSKLREPAALGAAAFAALMTLAAVINLLFTSGGSFSDTAYADTGNLLSFEVAIAVAAAVYLANHVFPALEKARLITLVALITVAVAGVLGLVSFFAGFGAQGASGTDKFTYFLGGAAGAIVIGLAAWYAWLTWQTHAPARPAAPITPVAPGGWTPPQPAQQQGQGGGVGQGGGMGQQGGLGQQSAMPQQQAGGAQQDAGFGWRPGNAAEQTAYLPPQGGNGPQTLQAQQSPTGSFAVQPQPGQQPQHPQQGGQPGQGHGVQPGQPGQPQGGSDQRTQMIPPVPPTMQEYAPDPQPWQPQGGSVPQPPPTRPMNQGEGPAEGDGPFGVGTWR